MKRMILATTNAHKLREVRQIFQDLDIEILSLSDVGLDHVNVIEDGETYEENSLKKAREIMALSKMDTIADDSGLEVDALDGAPGVYSARFSGENANDAANNALLLKRLEGVPEEKRTARFVSVISVVAADGKELAVRGTVEGVIGFVPEESGGFGYDPLFFCPETGCTFSQLSEEDKNRVSHRSRALRALHRLLLEG